jgi:hypothetical protein
VAIEDAMVWPVLETFLSCLETEFAHHPDPPAIIRHQTGNGNAVAQIEPTRTPARNECCEGLAWVRLAGFGPAAGPNLAPNPTVNNCYESWGIQIELGAVRCWPGAGKFAGPDVWAESAWLVAQDAAALRRAVSCCFLPGNTDHQAVVGQWTPVGITGQCVGGRLPVTVSSYVGDCCEDEANGS